MYKRALLFAVLPLILVTPIARAQASAPVAPAVQAAPPAKAIKFEVASIRLHAPGTMSYGPGFTDDGFTVHGVGAFSLVYSFFGNLRTVGLPDWGAVSYDIQAKVADQDVAAWKALDYKQKDVAVQALMEDRFKLKWHRETRQMAGYSLVVAKGGPKFKEATPGDQYPHGFKSLSETPLLGILYETARGVYSAQALTMAQLADSLQIHAGKPVMDKTGLTGKYDFTFKDEAQPAPPSPASAAGDAVASEPAVASIFTVLQEQLGLKLEPGATVPVEYVVVDHIERPTEN
jgi:uncharacterized protein (TIGR03435 family)